MAKEKLYRPCVGIVLLNMENKIFAGERIDTPGAWQMPQGGIDPGESLLEAAHRELEEEVGSSNVEILHILEEPLYYELPPELCQKHWGGQYCGQEQRWIAARFLGSDNEIDLNADEAPEFSQWQWMTFPELIDHIVPFKRDVYREIQTRLTDYL